MQVRLRLNKAREVMTHSMHHLHADYMTDYEDGLRRSGMKNNAMREARFFHLVQMLKFTQDIAGATAEAGAFRGLSSFLICRTLQRDNPSFRGEGHYLVDSFEGISPPVEQDGEFGKRRYAEGAFTGTSLETCAQTLRGFDKATIIKGWIPEVFGELPDNTYRFVHVDVDVYESTLNALNYFFPRLETGGVIVIDDHGPWPEGQWPGCRVAVGEFLEQNQAKFFVFGTGNAVIQKF